jgi:hypothetical protein
VRRPWIKQLVDREALKVRNIFRTFSDLFNLFLKTGGDALRFAQRLPLAIIFRAFGAAHTRFRTLDQSIKNTAAIKSAAVTHESTYLTQPITTTNAN